MHNQVPVWCATLLEEHGTAQFLQMWIDKVFQYIQVTTGCHSRSDKESGSEQMIVQHATSNINFGAVADVLHCSIRVFWSPDVYI
jgi:hypothetical protein